MGQMCYLFWIMGAGGDWVRGRDRQICMGDGLLAQGGVAYGDDVKSATHYFFALSSI